MNEINNLLIEIKKEIEAVSQGNYLPEEARTKLADLNTEFEKIRVSGNSNYNYANFILYNHNVKNFCLASGILNLKDALSIDIQQPNNEEIKGQILTTFKRKFDLLQTFSDKIIEIDHFSGQKIYLTKIDLHRFFWTLTSSPFFSKKIFLESCENYASFIFLYKSTIRPFNVYKETLINTQKQIKDYQKKFNQKKLYLYFIYYPNLLISFSTSGNLILHNLLEQILKHLEKTFTSEDKIITLSYETLFVISQQDINLSDQHFTYNDFSLLQYSQKIEYHSEDSWEKISSEYYKFLVESKEKSNL